MEIKDISVTLEKLHDVRGGQSIDVSSFGAQIGGNYASSSASSYGLGNTTVSGVTQIAPQSFSQSTSIHALDIDTTETTIVGSLVGFLN